MAAWVAVAALACPACAAAEQPSAAPSIGPVVAVPAVSGPPEGEWDCAAACRRWRAVLDRLDAHRARAYATGRTRLLNRVYLPRSRVLATDRRMLGAWTRRGAAVSGARLRVLDVSRLPSPGRSVRLRVVDRLAPATARLDGERIALPHDQPTEHLIELRRTPVGWRIASSSSRLTG
jgi:hypothetical protein